MSDAITEVWFTRCPVPTPLGLAHRLGLLDSAFEDAGIALRSIGDSGDRAVRESHFTHTLANSFRHGGNVPPIRARSEGRDTRLVGITWTDEFQALVTLPGRGLDRPGRLAGLRVGLPRRAGGIVDFQRATALKGLESALKIAGLSEGDVEQVDIDQKNDLIPDPADPSLFGLPRCQPYGAELAALLSGKVDAIYLKGAQGVSVANLFGLQTLVSFGFHPDPAIRINSGTPRLLTVDAGLIDARPDLVGVLIGTILHAARWAEGNPQDTRRIVAQESGTSEAAVTASNGADLHRNLGLSLEDDQIAAVESYKDFLGRHGFLAGDFSVTEWVDRRGWEHLARLREAAE